MIRQITPRYTVVPLFSVALVATALTVRAALADDQPATQPSIALSAPTSQPDSSSSYIRAKARYAALTKACIEKLHASDEFKSAQSDLESAKEARAAATGDDIATAAQKLMLARSALQNLERSALAADPAILATKRELNAAATALGGVDRAELPDLNRIILSYAEQSVGKVIGNGECWTLGHEAILLAHAQMPDSYVWGRQLASNETVLPGDVIQFTSCRFEGPHWWMQMGTPHHTAIVQKVESKTVYWILGQNPGPVVAKQIDFQYLKSGTYQIYRPLPQ